MHSLNVMIDESTTLDELAHRVSGTLLHHGISAVLSGGAAVSIYTHNEYQSYDLDFISDAPLDQVADILYGLGFVQHATRHFSHSNSRFDIEFPGSVLMIGDTMISEYAEDINDHGVLRLLTPTHSVMDRLAAYYHWRDGASLRQAIMVATRQPIDHQAVEEWSRTEGAMQEHSEFVKRLTTKPGYYR